jgi:hypothetical protein
MHSHITTEIRVADCSCLDTDRSAHIAQQRLNRSRNRSPLGICQITCRAG